MSALRFAAYLRLSTTDKQDPALSFPSQLKGCQHKAVEHGGEVACEFTDQESGAKQDRPGWSQLLHEARDRDSRRFDAVVIYSTSRLARDRFVAALFERELRDVTVPIHYATGAGDPDTPEGALFVGMQQLWDEFERNKLARETKRRIARGLRTGLPHRRTHPYGYRRQLHQLPTSHLGDRSKQPRHTAPRPPTSPRRRRDLPPARRPRPQPQSDLSGLVILPRLPPCSRSSVAARRAPQRTRGTHHRQTTSPPPETAADTGAPPRSARSCAIPSTPAGSSGTASTSPPPATTATDPASAPKKNGPSANKPTTRSSQTSSTQPAKPASSNAPDAKQPRPTAATYSPA